MGRVMTSSDRVRDSKSLYSRRPDCKSARTGSKFVIVFVLSFLFCGCHKPDVEKEREWKVIPDRPYLDLTEIKELCVLDSNYLSHISSVVTCPIVERETLDRLVSYIDSVNLSFQEDYMVAITLLGEEKMEMPCWPNKAYYPEGLCLTGFPRYGHYCKFVSLVDSTDHLALIDLIREEKIPITHFHDAGVFFEERWDYIEMYTEYMKKQE